VSKFGNLKEVRDKLNAESSTRNAETSTIRNAEMPDSQSQSQPVALPKRLGRPPAKRSDPAYTQVSGYVRRATLTATKRKLLDEDGREFSELLEELLSRWIAE
jgi:hypothetical protein